MELSDEASIDTNDVYQMVESIAYFEAYRHVLVGLQEVTELPFQVALCLFILFFLYLWYSNTAERVHRRVIGKHR